MHSSPRAGPAAEAPDAELLSGDELGVSASLDALLSGEDLAATVAGMGPELVQRLRTVLCRPRRKGPRRGGLSVESPRGLVTRPRPGRVMLYPPTRATSA